MTAATKTQVEMAYRAAKIAQAKTLAECAVAGMDREEADRWAQDAASDVYDATLAEA